MSRITTFIAAACLLTALAAPAAAQEFTPDAHTLLLLHGNGTTTGAAGETPTSSNGVAYTTGVLDQALNLATGARITYAAADNLAAPAGTIEFWLKPHWNGNDNQTYVALAWGTWSGIMVAKDGANNLRIIINRWGGGGLPERGAAFNVGAWTAEQWHHCAFTWDSANVRCYTDGELRASGAVGFTPPSPGNSTFQVSGEGTAQTLNGALDELRICDNARTAAEIQADYLAGVVPTSLTATPRVTKPWVTWPVYATLTVGTALGPVTIPQAAASWTSSNPAAVAVQPDGSLRAVGAGAATLTATWHGVSGPCNVTVRAPRLAPTHEALPADLTTPAAGAIWPVPVLIIRFLPTADGVNLDTAIAPDFWWDNPRTLAEMDADILAMNRRVKFALEQGSRFRAYRNAAAPPSLGYRVVDQVTLYEQTPPGKIVGYDQSDPLWEADWFAIFDRLDVRHYVEDLGVKEIWVWSGGLGRWPSFDPQVHDVQDFRGGWESNMSSPLTGDISNSNRDGTDLPVYAKSYVVYGYNFRRSQAEAVHDHGHQLESQFSYVNQLQDGNTDLFWKLWRGEDQNGNRLTGRCGDTHCPPNTVDDYDYENPAVVLSDIADWTWDASGTFSPVDPHTWGDLQWPWPDGEMDFSQRVETQWYMYWMMSMPGRNNHLAYGGDEMTDWWQYIGDWDAAITAGHGLHAQPALVGVPLAPNGDDAPLVLRPLRANPSGSTFAFALDAAGRGRLAVDVYDVRGHRVRQLRDEASAGTTISFTWDGRDDAGRALAAGTYLLRARDGERTATRKLSLVR